MRTTSHTLSSTAQRSYWLGRYLERAESTARLVTVNGRLLYDLPKRLPLGWQGPVNITGNRSHFDVLYGDPTEKNVTRFLINDSRNPGSLFRSLDNARENVRTLRGIIPRACVEAINELYLFARESLSEPHSRSRRAEGLSEVQASVQRIAHAHPRSPDRSLQAATPVPDWERRAPEVGPARSRRTHSPPAR